MSSNPNPADPIIEALSRALHEEAPDPRLSEKTKTFVNLAIDGEIVGAEMSDSANGVRPAGLRYRSSDERDLVYSFGDASGDTATKVEMRLVEGALMARLPREWDVQLVRLQTTTSFVDVDIDEDNYAICLGPFDSPLRMVVTCSDATFCTPWTIV